MRIANPHLIPKKGNRFMSYQAKKFKNNKNKGNDKIQNDLESQYLNESRSNENNENSTINNNNNNNNSNNNNNNSINNNNNNNNNNIINSSNINTNTNAAQTVKFKLKP